MRARMVAGLALTLVLATAPTVAAAEPAPPDWAAFGARQSAAAELTASDPPVYAEDYARAESYLAGLVAGGGIASAGPESQAWIAGALDLTGHPGEASAVLARLLPEQGADGSWGGRVGATGTALWAIALHARLAADAGYLRQNWGAIERGAGFLLTHQDPVTGDIGAVAGGPYPAASMGLGLLGLRQAAAAATVLGHRGSAARWGTAAAAAAAALEGDVRIARSGSADYFANALFDPGTGSLLQRREVVGAAALSLTYPGWGVKVGPGYFNGDDWVGAEPTFLYVLAAVWNGLPELGGSEYDAGLRLQCGSGEFAYQYHPPVGPQTGGFSAGPDCSDGRTKAGFTALYLLATHALLGVRSDPQGGVTVSPHLPPPWRSATIRAGGRTETVQGTPAVDPTVPFHRRRLAVVVGTDNGNESGLELGVAYEALVQGYLPWVFWYLNNDYGPLHNLYNLFHNLSRYSVIVLGHDALHGPASGSDVCSGGACAHPTPAAWFQGEAGALASWVQGGGRLVTTGDRTPLPLGGDLAATAAAAPAPLEDVTPTPAGARLGLSSAELSGLRPGAADYYSSVGRAYTVLATTPLGTAAAPVAIAARVGSGRIVQTTLGLSAATHDVGPAVGALLAWAMRGLPATHGAPRDDAALAQDAAGAITADWWRPAAGLFAAPPGTQDACGNGLTSLYPVTQIYALADDLGSSALWAEVAAALPHYYNPAYEGTGAYTACPGGTRAYYDDDGWLLNAMMAQYARQPDPALLAAAERLFAFLETGWRPGVGGEEFYPGCGCAEQVATGNFLDAALRLYLATKQGGYLTWADTVYAWEQAHMQGGPEANGLYYDFIQGSGDAVTGFRQYTYDTGLVLQADALFYRATGDPSYLRDGERLAAAGSAVFVVPADGAMEPAAASGPAFNSVYLAGARMLAALDGDPAWLQIGRTSARAAVLWDAQPAPGGTTYGANWGGVNTWYTAGHLDVLSQAGTARLFALLAPGEGGGPAPAGG